MRRVDPVIGLILLHLFAQASTRRAPYCQDMHRVAPDGEQDAEFPLPLAVEQNPHFVAESIGVGIDGASLGIGFQGVNAGPDAA